MQYLLQDQAEIGYGILAGATEFLQTLPRGILSASCWTAANL